MPAALSLSLFWFVYFGALGIYVPYYSLYLRENAGLSGTELGAVLAAWPLVGLLAQPLWGQIADRTGARSRLLAALTAASAAAYALLGLASGFWGMLLATAGLALFATAIIPVSLSVGLAALRQRSPHGFGLARTWGTVGFLLLVVSFPRALDWLQARRGLDALPGGPSEPGLGIMFGVVAALVLLASILGLWLPRDGAVGVRAQRRDWRQLLRHGPVVRLLAFALLAYFFLQGPIVLFPVYVRDHGGDMNTVGQMWIFMLALEIPLVALSGAGLQRLGVRGLIAIGVLAGGVRWTICGLTDNLAVIYAAQLLHGVGIAGLVLGGPLYVEAVVPERLRSTGQVLLSVVGPGLGGMGSNLVSGWLLESRGTDAPYLAGGLGALLLAGCATLILPTPPPREYPRGSAPAASTPGATGERIAERS